MNSFVLRKILLLFLLWGGVQAGMAQEAAPPRILAHPKPTIVASGYMTSLEVNSDAGATYQWFHNDVLVPRGTNRGITFNPAGFADAGEYYCVISNGGVSATSNVGRLTVVPRAELRSIASIPIEGYPEWIQVVGDRAYIADGVLHIYDVKSPAAPVKLGVYDAVTNRIMSAFVDGNRAYCAAGKTVHAVDVTDGSEPVLVQTFSVASSIEKLIVRNGMAYIACRGLVIFDVRDPVNPVLLGKYEGDTGYTLALAEKKDVLYSTGSFARIQVFDVSEPWEPKLVSKLNQGAYALDVAGDRLYGVPPSIIYDISDPRKPHLLSNRQAMSHSVRGVGDLVFYSGPIRDRVQLIDASIPSTTFLVGELQVSGTVRAFEWSNNLLFVVGEKFLEVVELVPATNPPVVTQALRDGLAVGGSSVRLEPGASGGGVLEWKWYKGQDLLVNETNRTLVIRGVSENHLSDYTAVAKNWAGETSVGTARLSLLEAPGFSVHISPEVPARPRLTNFLPEGLHARVEGSSDLVNWEIVWSGQATEEPVVVSDYHVPHTGGRFYRLKYGNE